MRSPVLLHCVQATGKFKEAFDEKERGAIPEKTYIKLVGHFSKSG